VVNEIQYYREIKISFRRLNEILELKSEVIDEKILPVSNFDIAMNNVSFLHESSQKKILDDVSVKFHYGKKYAIVGETGSGKSTILDLLLGMYKMQNGNISMGELVMSNETVYTFRNFISISSQLPLLANKSIIENIKLINPEIDDEEL
jgi:ABC-type bacteriocin/lantibiotic exporter with double-glycine peptidase domain